jgi:hypothetical protein
MAVDLRFGGRQMRKAVKQQGDLQAQWRFCRQAYQKASSFHGEVFFFSFSSPVLVA